MSGFEAQTSSEGAALGDAAQQAAPLADYPFEWVLPGHGQRVRLHAAAMRAELLRLADAMRGGDR